MEDLADHRNKCRFCLGKIRSSRAAFQITDDIEQSYHRLTSSKLKSSKNYSPVICKICFGDLESSVGFQQKIIKNQRRLEKFELEDPVKEEAVETAILLTEIKAECFEFSPSVIVQSWQEPSKEEIEETADQNRLEEKNSPLDVKEAPSPCDPDDDFSPLNDASDSSESKAKKENIVDEVKPRDHSKRVCPYCAETLCASGMTAHIESHENKINNTPLICDVCGYRCFYKVALRAHFRTRHAERFPQLAAKTDVGAQFASRLERRKKLLETIKAHPKWSNKFLAKKFNITLRSVKYFKSHYMETGTVERKKVPGRRIITELEIEIEKSFRLDPSLSHRQRARDFNVDRKKIERIAKQIGFKLQIDDSHRIHKCTICPSKYNALSNLKSHIRRKHKQAQ